MLGRLPWFAFERRIFAFFFFVFFDMVDKPNGPLVTFPLPVGEAPARSRHPLMWNGWRSGPMPVSLV